MNSAPIGVFDSGVGGLSVLREIRRELPGEDLLYVADSGYAPYGDRPREFIRERAERIVQFFVDAGVKAIVIACNTATAVAIQTLRLQFPVIMVAIEPAVKPAVGITRSGVVGVLATGQTLASDKFARLVAEYGKGVRIILQASPGLVEQVEKGELDSTGTRALVTRYISSLVERGADTIVLGCTHYPFLLPVIQAAAGPKVSIVDPSVAVARELHRRLKAGELLSPQGDPATERFWTSGVTSQVEPVVAKLWGKSVQVQCLPAALSSDKGRV